MPAQGAVFIKDVSGNTASIDSSGNLKINVAIGSINATINISGQNIVTTTPGFKTASGIAISCASGGTAISTSLASTAVTFTYQGSGRIFVGSSGSPSVGSGSTDFQRVGFPIYPSFSGQSPFINRFTISNAAFLNLSAETSGQIVFYNIETP